MMDNAKAKEAVKKAMMAKAMASIDPEFRVECRPCNLLMVLLTLMDAWDLLGLTFITLEIWLMVHLLAQLVQ